MWYIFEYSQASISYTVYIYTAWPFHNRYILKQDILVRVEIMKRSGARVSLYKIPALISQKFVSLSDLVFSYGNIMADTVSGIPGVILL